MISTPRLRGALSPPALCSPAHPPTHNPQPTNQSPGLRRQALRRADQIETAEGGAAGRDYFLPIVADAEAGFGGPLNAYELTRHLIEAGAAAVHFEDQLSSEKKCGHLGGKVLVPTAAAIRNLVAGAVGSVVGWWWWVGGGWVGGGG